MHTGHDFRCSCRQVNMQHANVDQAAIEPAPCRSSPPCFSLFLVWSHVVSLNHNDKPPEPKRQAPSPTPPSAATKATESHKSLSPVSSSVDGRPQVCGSTGPLDAPFMCVDSDSSEIFAL